MEAQMRGFRFRTKRNTANLVGLPRLLKRPPNARITRQARAAIGRPFKGGNHDDHRETPFTFSFMTSSTTVTNPSDRAAAPSRDRDSEAATLRIGRSPRLAIRVTLKRLGATQKPI